MFRRNSIKTSDNRNMKRADSLSWHNRRVDHIGLENVADNHSAASEVVSLQAMSKHSAGLFLIR